MYPPGENKLKKKKSGYQTSEASVNLHSQHAPTIPAKQGSVSFPFPPQMPLQITQNSLHIFFTDHLAVVISWGKSCDRTVPEYMSTCVCHEHPL